MTTPEPTFLTPRQVAARLQVSVSSLIRMVGRGEFPEPRHLGRLTRWPTAQVERWESDQLQPA